MKRILVQTLRGRRFAILVHAGFWLLLYLAAVGLGGKAPVYRDAIAISAPAQSPAPVAKLPTLFSPGGWPKPVADTNLVSAFYTRHFIPPPTPPPPAPTTRKIEVTYLGFYQSEGGPQQVMVRLADEFLNQPVGAHISTNWLVGLATMQTLILTNLAGQTNVLPLNVKKEIEVPIQ